ncbi:uncharacterized protein LDX57_006435 [Aspergillus melleus]|uniref:uncharacterized protein n=1 Tax=Aspergillus melleus TaxID=138277 RepID=UPI001E8E4201|nr:uncharacterized protein LDX57_006435 [Aspergillus melleus]KAH8428751.1 hypothetical protein LDX57_006435 [Aspergillus melleus]
MATLGIAVSFRTIGLLIGPSGPGFVYPALSPNTSSSLSPELQFESEIIAETHMKRSRSCSPVLAPKRCKPIPAIACLTYDALKEHDRNTQSLSPFTLLDMAPEERTISTLRSEASGREREVKEKEYDSLRHIVIPPPSTRSSQRSRSSSPSRPSEAQYRAGPLRRANIFVDDDIPTDVSHYANNRVFNTLDDHGINLYKVTEKFWSESKELVKKSAGKVEWLAALYTAIDDLRPPALEIARSGGRLPFP